MRFYCRSALNRDDLPRPRGRPKADEPSTTITAWVPAKEYDRLVKLANKQEQSLSSLIRQCLSQR